jgi:hypothetical protein
LNKANLLKMKKAQEVLREYKPLQQKKQAKKEG